MLKQVLRSGKTSVDIWNELESAYPGQVRTYKTVSKWANRYKAGRESVEDDERSGRPITGTTSSNIDKVRNLIDGNSHISIAQIEAETFLSRGTIFKIIHESLELNKVTSRWIPYLFTDVPREKRLAACRHNLSMFESGKWRICDVVTGDESWIYWRQLGTKSSNMSWVGVDQPPGTVVRQGRFEPKSMITVFFKSTGPVLVDFLERGKTITAAHYVKNCLKPLVKALNMERPTAGTKSMKMLHDNARPHVAQPVISYLVQ
jgi:hypothetical protein